uniref:Uncharacterized protein n=1 Tax=Arundo donax TaxID=35708 RepID=A0A0A9HGM4_ARUDO
MFVVFVGFNVLFFWRPFNLLSLECMLELGIQAFSVLSHRTLSACHDSHDTGPLAVLL